MTRLTSTPTSTLQIIVPKKVRSIRDMSTHARILDTQLGLSHIRNEDGHRLTSNSKSSLEESLLRD
jgi:hypothetical protein